MACIIKSYSSYERYRRNKRRAKKTGTFENCWTVYRGLTKFWVLMEIM